ALNRPPHMQSTTEIKTIFHTSLERAFKSPMLCDITKIHTGHGITPRVTHCTEDDNWGKVGGSRKVFMAKTPAFKGGESSLDKVLERKENEYWKIEISDFKSWSMGFEKFHGEWSTRPIEEGKVEVRYRYTLFSNSILFYPFHWLFTKLVWRNYMKQVMENVRSLAMSDAAYLHN
ncbi:MAG TPA: hypothetical protein VFX48_00275, partial [Saprospiraceae bacterium]|nr:hypothetical protein [Saprospiraceae bacterium]